MTPLGYLDAAGQRAHIILPLTWLTIAIFFRSSSLSSLVAASYAPAYYLIGGGIAWPLDRTALVAIIVMSLLLIWRHRENIRRLAAGTESKLGSKKKPT